jgi:Spy/CpxP family protein refolding chaperone
MVQILLNLPEELAEQAAAAGILEDEKLRALISAEVERQAKISRLFESMKKLQQANTLSQEEIDAEIETSRV